MKRLTLMIILGAALAALAIAPTVSAATAPDTPDDAVSAPVADDAEAKRIFSEYKCNTCHTLKAKGIALTGEPDEDGKDAPDLSKAGEKRDKKWIASYLLKKKEIDGEKHKKRFSGSKAELKAIATWLAGLK